jgi:hypothetical protein
MTAGGLLFLHQIGTGNTALGLGNLMSNTTGSNNTAVGASALASNTSGIRNTAVGGAALNLNTSGESNTALGSLALPTNTTGSFNTAMGQNALNLNSDGSDNTALGFGALRGNTSGSGNIAIGYTAAYNPTAPFDSIFIGNSGFEGDTATIRIGTAGTQTTAFMAGIRGVTTGNNNGVAVLIDSNGQLGTVSSSRRYKEDIRPMDDVSAALLKLRPVTFRYKKPYADGSKPIQYGLIAEEVADVLPDLAVFNADGTPETVKYHLLPSFLLAEVQRQEKIITSQADQMATLERRLTDLEARLVALHGLAQHAQR